MLLFKTLPSQFADVCPDANNRKTLTEFEP